MKKNGHNAVDTVVEMAALATPNGATLDGIDSCNPGLALSAKHEEVPESEPDLHEKSDVKLPRSTNRKQGERKATGNSTPPRRPRVAVDGEIAKLDAWLQKQALKLKNLEATGRKLKVDFVQNAKEKGEILHEVNQRLGGGKRFETWVREESGIGYSTARLWMDVAKNFELVKKLFANSNPLELTVRQVRDAIRDDRQAQGGGKPGSGRRKSQDEEGDSVDAPDIAEGGTPNSDNDDPRTTKRWEQAAATAEAAAAETEVGDIESGGETNGPQHTHYKMRFGVANPADQTTIYESLLKWSPISTTAGAKHSVSVSIRPKDIGAALQKLGQALEANQPKTLKVSIEL